MFAMLANFNWKKALMIFGFLIIASAIGFALYYLFFKPLAPAPEKPTPVEITQLPGAVTGKPPGIVAPEAPKPAAPSPAKIKIPAEKEIKPDEIAKGGLTKVKTLTAEPISNITLDSAGANPIAYDPENGQFFAIDENGEKKLLTNRVYKNVEKLAWSPQKNQAILEFPDGTNILYNFSTDKQITLPKDWTQFSFNSSGNNIVFKDNNPNPEFKYLSVANADGSGQKYVEYLGTEEINFKTDWSPNGQIIAQYSTPFNAVSSKLYFVGQNQENFKSVIIDGYGAQTKWTPDGKKLLYSSYSKDTDYKPVLHIVNASGNAIGSEHHNLKINTWANKCAFADESTAYCAVPKELPYGANLSPKLTENVPDYIYKINLENGVKSFVAQPELDYSIDQLQVNEDGSALYFLDKATKAMHQIKLK